MRTPIVALLMRFLGGLRFPTLLKLSALLFVISFFTPIPMIDELIFGLTTLLLASWKKHSDEKKMPKPDPNARPVIEHNDIKKPR